MFRFWGRVPRWLIYVFCVPVSIYSIMGIINDKDIIGSIGYILVLLISLSLMIFAKSTKINHAQVMAEMGIKIPSQEDYKNLIDNINFVHVRTPSKKFFSYSFYIFTQNRELLYSIKQTSTYKYSIYNPYNDVIGIISLSSFISPSFNIKIHDKVFKFKSKIKNFDFEYDIEGIPLKFESSRLSDRKLNENQNILDINGNILAKTQNNTIYSNLPPGNFDITFYNDKTLTTEITLLFITDIIAKVKLEWQRRNG